MSIVITGTPGVGKHTITDTIAGKLGLSIIDVNAVAAGSGLFHDGDVDVSILGKIIRDSIIDPSIIVGHLAPYLLYSEQAKRVIVLRRDPYELLDTYKKRRYTDRKKMDNAASEILGVIFHDARDRFGSKAVQVKVDNKDATTYRVLDAINSGHGDSDIDWLGMVARNGDLERFFSY